jgi:PAS domain S-box-containing protein
MEPLIAVLDVISLLGFSAALFVAFRVAHPVWDRPSKLFFGLSMSVYVFVGFSNVLEHSGVTGALDSYEDYAENLFLPFFLFFLFSMRSRQELNMRRQAEQGLRDVVADAYLEKAKTEAVIAAIGDILTIQDRNFKIIYQNNACKQFVGEHIGDFCYRVFNQQEDVCGDCALVHAFEDGRVHRTRRSVISAAGPVTVELMASPVRNAAGEIVAGIEVIRDISEELRAAEALRESEQRYRVLFESNPNPMWVYDLETLAFLGVNEAAISHYGYSRDEFLSMTIKDIRPAEDVPLLMENVAQVTEGLDEAGVWRHRKKDGTVIDVVITSHTIAFGGRRAEVVLAHDVTEKRRAEEDLVKARARLEFLVSSSPAAIYTCDVGGSWSARYMSKNIKDILGYDYRENLDDPRFWVDRIHPDDRERVLSNLSILLDTGHHTHQYRFLHKDGTYRWVNDEVRIVRDERGNPTECIGYLVDVTDRKQMEDELLKAQKLESLGVLAGGIAHDFNNLLTSILGNVSLAKMYSGQHPQAAGRLEEAEKASLRARDLTQQLLTFSRGGLPVKKTIGLAQVVRDATGFALRGSRAKSELRISDDLCPVEADEGQISQVIHNLVINADQAMPDGGAITVSCDTVKLRNGEVPPLVAGRYVRISVADQGIGVPKEHFKKIFDPYFTTKQKGSGLGLATCYSIIKRHDGHITLESELGKGAKFSLYLPTSARCEEQRESGPAVPVKGTGRVLVMDDEEMVLDVAGAIMKSLGYDVTTARDGDEAILLVRTARHAGVPFDAVIMDLTIPGGMGGREAIGPIREIDPAVKAIVSSGYSNDPVMAAHREHGFDGVVTKPYTVARLAETLVAVLKKE